jgi:CDP-diacylglycerol--glycerol-3-phosphate 3-phosphatidyltransferase
VTAADGTGQVPEGLVTDGPVTDGLVSQVQPVSVWNVANALTVARLLLVPVFVALLFWEEAAGSAWRPWAFAAFAVASATDRLDGDLARKRGLVTDFGKIADPIADKALIGGALVSLSLLGELAWWVTVLVLVREVGVTVLRFWVIRHGVIPASRGGKLKTLLQAVATGLYLLVLDGWLKTVSGVLLGAAVVVTVVTGLDYVYRALKLRRTSKRAAAARPVQQKAPEPNGGR